MKFEGSLNNRLEENKMFCKEIKVGTGVTEYLWSDRKAYEVVAVKDQKHVSIRKYEAKHIGEGFENKWELISDKSNPVINLVKRGNGWYWENELTVETLKEAERRMKEEKDPMMMIYIGTCGFDIDKIKENGKSQKRYRKMNVSFGVADYYYDYEF